MCENASYYLSGGEVVRTVSVTTDAYGRELQYKTIRRLT